MKKSDFHEINTFLKTLKLVKKSKTCLVFTEENNKKYHCNS